MDKKIEAILDALLRNIEVLNDEVERLGRSEQFEPSDMTIEFIGRLRGSCAGSLTNLRTLERAILRRLRPPGDEQPPLH